LVFSDERERENLMMLWNGGEQIPTRWSMVVSKLNLVECTNELVGFVEDEERKMMAAFF